MEKLDKLTILNLTGELIPELRSYFESRNIVVIDPLNGMKELEWTHILTKDIHDFNLLNKTYEITLKNRHIISLSKVDDIQNFTLNNGNIVLDECWFKGSMGKFILDKYFHGYGGSSLSENYPSFKELGSFNVVNPFSTGDYLDRLVQNAFENQVEALSVKTFFDHLIMYVTGLKNSGKAGVPFEVVYGAYDNIFAVQVHFFSQGIELLDVARSLSSMITRKAEEYYLNIAVQSADFFDFSFMPEVNKIVITSLWTKDKRVRFENRGLMFTSLKDTSALVSYVQDSSQTSLVLGGDPADYSHKVTLPSDSAEEIAKTLIPPLQSEDESPIVVPGGVPEEIVKQIVKGNSDAVPDEVRLVKGEPELDKLVQTVKGKFDEEDKTVYRIGGEKLDVDKVAFNLASKVDTTTKEQNLSVRSLVDSLPKSIKTGLFDFAKGLNKQVEDLTESDLAHFQLQKMPGILQKELVRSINVDPKAAAAGPVGNSKNEAKLASENERLRNQIKTLTSEVRILKESRNKLAEIQMKAQAASEMVGLKDDPDEALRKEFEKKLKDQKVLNDQDLKKLAGFLERESKLVTDLKHEETRARKLELEARQKEAFFAQELEKVERQSKAKDLIVIKTKDTFTKLLDKKDREIFDLKVKSDQIAKALNSGPSNAQVQQLKDYEKQNQNLTRQVEMMKAKIASLATNMQPSKSEDALKEEARKLQMLVQQTQNQLDLSKKENEKLQAKLRIEAGELLMLKQDKTRLESELKKAVFESKESASKTQHNPGHDQELKRLSAQNQILDSQLKEAAQKISALDLKLAEASKVQKQNAAASGEDKKAQQLEGTVKKLTQDLVAAKNQLAEEKKETNKLRQEKTALQNQLDKLKKEADKSKPAAPKKPGGKAA